MYAFLMKTMTIISQKRNSQPAIKKMRNRNIQKDLWAINMCFIVYTINSMGFNISILEKK